jgi:hypothetical protein
MKTFLTKLKTLFIIIWNFSDNGLFNKVQGKLTILCLKYSKRL